MPYLIDKWCLEREIVQKVIKRSLFIVLLQNKVRKFSGPNSSSLVQTAHSYRVGPHSVSSLPLDKQA